MKKAIRTSFQFVYPVVIWLLLNTNSLIANNSSNYIPFADSNAVWKIVYYCVQPAPLTFCNYVQYSLGSDTVINLTTYHKLYRTSFDVQCDTVIVHGPSYYGGIRQDTIQKHVNYIDFNGLDTILYRFDIEVGDTIHYAVNLLNPNVIIAIDSILIGNSFRRRYQLLDITLSPIPGNYFYIIEGIGSENGLLELLTPITSILTCYAENNTTLYIDSNYTQSCHSPLDSCLTASINVYPSNEKNIVPYLNSTDGNLHFINVEGEKLKIEIYDLYGRILLTKIIQGSESVYLHLPFGVYVYRISLDYNRHLTGKIIFN